MQSVLLKNRGEFLIFYQLEMLIVSALLPQNRAFPPLSISPSPHLSLTMLLISQVLPDSVMVSQSVLLPVALPALTNAPPGFFPLANFFHFWVTTSVKAGTEDLTIPNIPIFQNLHLRHPSLHFELTSQSCERSSQL